MKPITTQSIHALQRASLAEPYSRADKGALPQERLLSDGNWAVGLSVNK